MKPFFNPKAVCSLILVILLFSPGLFAADWPSPAVRSGTTLPRQRDIAVTLDGAGAYLPEIEGVSSYSTGLAEGILTWNLGIVFGLGLFGQHSLSMLFMEGVQMLAFGHEVGARYLVGRHVSVEAAYLGHRLEYEWIDGDPWAVGGVFDHGGEVGVWGRVEPLDRLRVEAHLLGRYFGEPDPADRDARHHYVDNQWVLGGGLDLSIMPFDGQSVVLRLEILRVDRAGRRRYGVERVTWNIIGAVFWRMMLTHRVGIELGARISTDMLAGRVPMLEIKRSMINEPMATAVAGVFFSL